MMLFTLLLFSTLLHCVYSQVDPDLDPVLYKAIQKAVVKDESNLLTLKSLFYPPSPGNSEQIRFNIPECSLAVKVKADYLPDHWNNCSHCDADLSRAGYYCYNENIYFESYSEIQSKELFLYVEATVALLEEIEFFSVGLFSILTNQNLVSGHTDCVLSIIIDYELDSLQDYSSVRVTETLKAVLLWVCLF